MFLSCKKKCRLFHILFSITYVCNFYSRDFLRLRFQNLEDPNSVKCLAVWKLTGNAPSSKLHQGGQGINVQKTLIQTLWWPVSEILFNNPLQPAPSECTLLALIKILTYYILKQMILIILFYFLSMSMYLTILIGIKCLHKVIVT